MRVYIDSGAFIAFLDRSDGLHSDVVALFAEMPRGCATSSHVVAETYSWFLHKLGEDRARLFRLFLADLNTVQILHSDEEHRAKVDRKLEALRGQKLTWVDASSLVWLDDLGIPLVWGTDQHLGLGGASVIPGPRRR